MGHNYIGTEHLLLGVLFTGGPTAEAFAALGLPPQRAEELITAELTAYQANLQGQLTSMGRNHPAPGPAPRRARPANQASYLQAADLFAPPGRGQQSGCTSRSTGGIPMYIGIGTVVVIVIIVLIVLALRR